MTKKQQKQLDAYIEKLGITTEGELFVLKHILHRDWNRDILLIDINTIKYNASGYGGLVLVNCRTRNGSYEFSVSHLNPDEWDDALGDQESYISSDLYHKMD